MQKQSPGGVLRKDVLKNFPKFLKKCLRESPFFNKVAGLRSANLLKERLVHAFPFEFCKIFNNTFLIEHLCWLLPKMKYDTMILIKSHDPVKFVDNKKRLVIMY